MFEKYEEDVVTYHPRDFQLWLDVRATNRPDRNQVYKISITSVREMKLGRNASTLDTQQFNLDQSTLKLKARVLKQVIKIIIKLEKERKAR